MRNDKKNNSNDILSLVKSLPYFSLADLKLAKKDNLYLKITLSRYSKNGRVIRLKKGYYVTAEFLNKIRNTNGLDGYLEFLANILYPSSYLSLEYVLCRHGVLSESVYNYTSVSIKKTKVFSNTLGNFIYHKIRTGLFTGYEIDKENGFSILKASKAKALFDYLYLRKHLLSDKKSVEELRLNLENFTIIDKNELMKYIFLEKSKKMENIFKFLDFN